MPAEDDAPTARRAGQARAWAVAMDPVYGVIGFGLIGFGIDYLAGTRPMWTIILAILGLIGGFWRFVREANRLNKDSTRKWQGRPFRAVPPEDDESDEGSQF